MEYFKRKNCLLFMGENSLKWLILRGHPELLDADGQKNRGRVTKRLREGEEIFCWKGIEWVSLEKDVRMFNKNNPNVNLNVFTAEEEKIIPLYPSKNKGKMEIDLFYLEGQLYLITNFTRLICAQSGKQGLRVSL